MKIRFVRQYDSRDCGPACLKMIAGYFGKEFPLQFLRERTHITKNGVSFLGLYDAAESIGLKPAGVKVTFDQLVAEVPKPCIVHWKKRHFVVVIKARQNYVRVADPALGFVRYTPLEFKKSWISTVHEDKPMGMGMILDPTHEFSERVGMKTDHKKSFDFILQYLNPYRKQLLQGLLYLIFGSATLLLMPYLSKSIVDKGLSNDSLSFIGLVLIAQFLLVIGKTGLEYVRSWLLLHISLRVNFRLLSDYLTKLMRLPLGFFETRRTGDILQRIGDHSRIEAFITQSGLGFLFSVFNILILGTALGLYSLLILLVFTVSGCLYILWIRLFLAKRSELDHRRFQEQSENQNNLIQLISGVMEIQINACQRSKRRTWEAIQTRILRTRLASLALAQKIQSGSILINEARNLIITFLAARFVINGQITLGEMFAIQFIVGQLIGPIEQVASFTYGLQDAQLSLVRLSEVHNYPVHLTKDEQSIISLPEDKTIRVTNVTFQYEGPRSPKVLDDVTMEIPVNKTTAIVGASGSGKTTLIKLLMGLYQPAVGGISVGGIPIHLLDQGSYRAAYGAVMQNGYLFSDTIANNIGLSDQPLDPVRLTKACKIANVEEFLINNPMGHNAEIGPEGMGLSQGQKQRILIARAIYKNPEILFFDEATNSLDAKNEKVILENLIPFYKGRTAVVVAHRLSTVMNADQIFVMDNGKIVESGTHDSLVMARGVYYSLVKNQIELGL